MTTTSNLNTIHTGEQVILHLYGTRTVVTVERTTKTQIIVGNDRRFRRSDGVPLGGRRYEGPWISPATDAAVTNLRKENARRVLVRSLNRITRTANYSGADLTDILDQLTEATNNFRAHLGK